MNKQASRTYALRPFKELRIKAEDANFENMKTPESWPTIKLLPGPNDYYEKLTKRTNPEKSAQYTAECFGKELVPNTEYPIRPGTRTAFFTWGGCTLQIKGHFAQEYEASNNSMKEYLNFAEILENRRLLATLQKEFGPRVLVTGAGSSGKSSLCSILCNYALKTNWNPVYVELDPRCSTDKDSLQFLPGMIGACVMEFHSFNEPTDPLQFHYGYSDVLSQPKLYTNLCRCLALSVYLRMLKNLKETEGSWRTEDYQNNTSKLIAASGMIINGPNATSLEIISEIVDTFNVDIIAVVDDPSLKHNLNQIYKLERNYESLDSSNNAPLGISVIGLSKSDGSVLVDNNRISHIKRVRWRNYFQGNIETPLKPQNLRILFSEYTFLMYESTSSIPVSALPADYIPEDSEPFLLNKWQGSPRMLLNAILSVAGTDELEFVSKSNISCILHVRGVEKVSADLNEVNDLDQQDENYILELWCPEVVNGKLFSRIIIVPSDLSQLKWQADSF